MKTTLEKSDKESQDISRVMSILGKRKSAAKTAAARRNARTRWDRVKGAALLAAS